MTDNTPNNTVPVLLLGGFVIALLIILGIVGIIFIRGYTFVKQEIIQPASTPTPQIIYVKETPSDITFTVSKANAAQPNAVNPIDREYTVLTTDGDILVLSSYYSWDDLELQHSYTCDVVDTLSNYGRDVYSVKSCNGYRYPIVYHDNYGDYYDGYYPYDDHHYYNRNDGTYNDKYDMDDWSRDVYKYFHYKGQYWECTGKICNKISVTKIPSYVTIYETIPPAFY